MSDIFPRRNLPPEAEEWGRTVEDVHLDHETRLAVIEARGKATNRSSAATSTDLARQLQSLSQAIDDIAAAQRSIPKPYSDSTAPSNFGLSPGWVTVASLGMPQMGTASLWAGANVDLRTPSQSVVTARHRLIFKGVASPEIPGAFEFRESDGMWHNTAYLQFAWGAVTVTPSDSVFLQTIADDAGSWPGGTGSRAVLTVQGALTG